MLRLGVVLATVVVLTEGGGYFPPKNGHYYRFSKILQVTGWFNTSCSLFVLYLHWKLGLLRQKFTFMAQLVLAMTVFQLVQDLALAYEFECGEYTGSDDDAFWGSPRVNSKGYEGRRCNKSQYFIEESSGIMLQSITLQMATIFFLVVVYAKTFNFAKWLFYTNVFSAVVALVTASVNSFGSIRCNRQYSPAGVAKTLYSCPPPPDMPNHLTKDNNYWAPGKFAWYFAEQLRLILAVTSLFLVGCALFIFYSRFRHASVKPSKSLAMGALATKIAWYPALQALSRLPCLYVTLYGSFWYMDVNRQGNPHDDSARKDANTTRVSMGYAYAILAPSGGFLMMVLFLLNNVVARPWISGILARAGIIDPPKASASTAPRPFSESTGRRSESLASAVGWRNARVVSVAVLANRCAELDEEDLLANIDQNADASEEQWQAALLRAPPSPAPVYTYDQDRGQSYGDEARYSSRGHSSRSSTASSARFVDSPSFVNPSSVYVARLSLQITENNPLHDLRHVHIKSGKRATSQTAPPLRDSTGRRSFGEYAPREPSLCGEIIQRPLSSPRDSGVTVHIKRAGHGQL